MEQNNLLDTVTDIIAQWKDRIHEYMIVNTPNKVSIYLSMEEDYMAEFFRVRCKAPWQTEWFVFDIEDFDVVKQEVLQLE